jgi:hypothetical protein
VIGRSSNSGEELSAELERVLLNRIIDYNVSSEGFQGGILPPGGTLGPAANKNASPSEMAIIVLQLFSGEATGSIPPQF